MKEILQITITHPVATCFILVCFGCCASEIIGAFFGKTKVRSNREYFAAMAMQGFLANPGAYADNKRVARLSVMQADALSEELSNTTNTK